MPNYLDQIQCLKCGTCSVYQPTKRGWQYEGRNPLKRDNAPVAVACPECKHVYLYSEPTLPPVPIPTQQEAPETKYPIAFYVPIVCGEADCDTPLWIKAVRQEGTTLEDVCREVPTWTLHDLRCPMGNPIQVPEIQPGWDTNGPIN